LIGGVSEDMWLIRTRSRAGGKEFLAFIIIGAGLLLLRVGEAGGQLFLALPMRSAPGVLSPATFLITGFSPES